MKTKIDPQEIVDSMKIRPNIPFIFQVDAIGECPKSFVNEFTSHTITAKSWWDKGQSGVTYINSPSWFIEAIQVLNRAESEAQSFLLEERRKK